MQVGIGLPNAIPGTTGATLLEWARRADAGPFSTLGVLDRLRYDSADPFVVLAAAAAVTERIGLATTIAIGPLRRGAVLAKQAVSVHALAPGRVTVGLAVGARPDDYESAEAEYGTRGAVLSRELSYLRGPFESAGIGPAATFGEGGIPLLIGGAGPAALTRMARYADGYVHGGGPPRAFGSAAVKARAAWHDLDRPGDPALWGQGYVALADADRGREYLLDYYAFTGPFAVRIAASALTDAAAVRDFVRGYAAEGCDELILFPTTDDPDEVDRLAEILS
ncbi:MAG TPA: LLM class flavin-dependent oxidoreductase [Amycolatopsis sp.]|nr:LLM class flavin-dependent oxidoreductase [Amycolatopsis sp.]